MGGSLPLAISYGWSLQFDAASGAEALAFLGAECRG
jgi:hypothetical protein